MSKNLVPFALCAIGLLSLVLQGCKPQEGKDSRAAGRAVEADPPEVYMNDPVFRKALAEQSGERKELARLRNRLRTEMVAKIEAMKAKMPEADDAAIKAELEKDPEWNDLYRKITDANEAIEDNRKHTTKIVGERIAPKGNKVSK